MAKKMYKDAMASSVYSNSTGSVKMASHMIYEDNSAPGTLPRTSVNKAYPEVGTAGSMANDSVEYSDKLSNQRANAAKSQNPKKPY